MLCRMTSDVQEFWDGQAASFDEEADHGLLDPAVRAAWSELLLPELPPSPARVVDLGCGTGSITALLAGEGYVVHGMDLSERMVAIARTKLVNAGLFAEVVQGDAAHPPFRPASFDVVFARHVLWALPDPEVGLAHWTRLLRPGGRLVLVEGFWSTGAGIRANRCRDLVAEQREEVAVRLLDDPRFWGRTISDERYLLTSLR